MLVKYSLLGLFVGSLSLPALAIKSACDSPIYCYGDLLHAVQMAKLYADDKTFVDKPTKRPVDEVLAGFESIGGINATRQALKVFVLNNFAEEGQELKQINDLPQFNPNPEFLQKVHDPLLREFGRTVNGYWKTLIREQDLTQLCDGCVSSMLPLKYHFVVPGGRFREIYYWDTYFTLEGLLISGLKDIAKSNIRDLLDFVDMFGFVPNGARVYYQDRSQPPMLSLMVQLYDRYAKGDGFAASALPQLLKEYEYWAKHHSVTVHASDGDHVLSRYIVDTDQPRPEAYSADYNLAHSASTNPQRQAQIYADMAAGAESGWDYSSRWVRDPLAPPDKILQGIRTSHVVPVELNAILYFNERYLASLLRRTGRKGKARQFELKAEARLKAIQSVFYDWNSGLYHDFILSDDNSGRGNQSDIISPASVWPYWWFGNSIDGDGAQKAFSFVSEVLAKNPGGIPATLINTGQQWDAPMAWPPLQYTTIQGAFATGNRKLATDIAQAYVNNVFCAWYNTGGSIPNVLAQQPGTSDTGHMFEKFNSTAVGVQGGGGEYTVQAGFGWTNGVLLWVLNNFGDVLKTPVCPGTHIAIQSGSAISSAPHAASTY
ncbi:hypothetical protein LPJ73_002826 [Coemansia sp. RSA 2703]|nr:hypothetical protein LPJ73_002826 [Coemansia sp. RSA 2703]KAJ2371807.1 hypothetical protein IW150_004424 [Coemansia sp. RSA 2607]